MTASAESNLVARRKVFAALDVLHAYAPAELARISRFMTGIVVYPLHTISGAWESGLATCLLDEKYILDDETSPEEVASTIVHELTHARLERAGFRYTEPQRARCERICFLAERNFARRLPDCLLRRQLEDRIARYLTIPADRWTDRALAHNWAQRRQFLPRWERILYAIADLILGRRATA